MRKQPGLLEHPARAPGEVLERRRAPERRELVARRPVPRLGPVAEREERLGAAGRPARARDLEHLVLGEVRALAASGRPRERAVAADVAAEHRQRNEDLRRIGDERPVPRARSRRASAVRSSQRRTEELGDEARHRRWVVAGRSPRAGAESIRQGAGQILHGCPRRDPRAAPRRGGRVAARATHGRRVDARAAERVGVRPVHARSATAGRRIRPTRRHGPNAPNESMRTTTLAFERPTRYREDAAGSAGREALPGA